MRKQQRTGRRRFGAATRQVKPLRARNGRRLPVALFMTDPERTAGFETIIASLPPGWGVVWRHFGSADRHATGARLARLCRRRRLVLLVSGDPDLARRIGADGVHWPEAMLGARRRTTGWMTTRRIETASAHSRRALVRARRAGVDAAIVSTVFPSRSPSAGHAMGAIRFRLLARGGALPVYALGGINAGNAARIAAHAAGWAAVEAVVGVWDATRGPA